MTAAEQKAALAARLIGRTIVAVEWAAACDFGFQYPAGQGPTWDGEVNALILDDGARVSFSASDQVGVDDVWLAVEHAALRGNPPTKRVTGP